MPSGRFKGSRSRMRSGTTSLISASREGASTTRSMAFTSVGSGPMCRNANASGSSKGIMGERLLEQGLVLGGVEQTARLLRVRELQHDQPRFVWSFVHNLRLVLEI